MKKSTKRLLVLTSAAVAGMYAYPSLRFSTSIFLISPHSKNHPNQHNCWLFYFFKNLTQKLFSSCFHGAMVL